MVLCDKLLTEWIKASKHEPVFRSRWPNSYEGFGKSAVAMAVRSLLPVSSKASTEPIPYWTPFYNHASHVEQNRPRSMMTEPLRTQLPPQTCRNRFERSSMIIKYLAVFSDLPHAQRKLLFLVIVVAIDSTVVGQVWEYILQMLPLPQMNLHFITQKVLNISATFFVFAPSMNRNFGYCEVMITSAVFLNRLSKVLDGQDAKIYA